MRVCSVCGTENPSSALHCMKCGNLLVDEASLTEEQKLQKKLQEAEKENELLKAALEAKLKGSLNVEEPVLDTTLDDNVEFGEEDEGCCGEEFGSEEVIVDDSTNLGETVSVDSSTEEVTPPKSGPSNKSLLILAIGLLLLAGIVGGLIYRSEVYLPDKRDAEAPRYYVYSTSLKIRNNPLFDGDANIIGRVSYGTELIVYDSSPGEYFRCKFCPYDANGKAIKSQAIEGFVHYKYLLPKDDFYLLNSIFGNDDAKKMLSETRYKRALLEIYKRNNYIGNLTKEDVERYGLSPSLLYNAEGRYQIFCRGEKSTSNNVYRSRKYRKDSKYLDAAIMLDNLNDPSDRLFLYFAFNDDESFNLLSSVHTSRKGYMQDGTLRLYEDNGSYRVAVNFVE